MKTETVLKTNNSDSGLPKFAEFTALAHVEVAKTWGVSVEKVAYSVGFNEDELPPVGTSTILTLVVEGQKITFRIRE